MGSAACDCCLSDDYEGATDPTWDGYLCVMCQPCPRCGRFGTDCGDRYCDPCPTCAGSGQVTVSEPSRRGVGAPYLNPVTIPCPDCTKR